MLTASACSGDAMDLMSYRVTPTPGAWRACPMTAVEIDAHPDADRIWATIMRARAEYSGGHDGDFSAKWLPGR